MAAVPVPGPTVEGVTLLGWMEREPAINYLMNDCVFPEPLMRERAEEIWRGYRDRVAALPERDATAPQRTQLTTNELAAANNFLRFHNNSPNLPGVIKIEPMNLVAHQLTVIIDQAQRYMADARESSLRYARHSLGTARGAHNMNVQHVLNAMDVSVPHGEFAFIFIQQTHQFQILELARHVSVAVFQERMLLWAGYHRSYARIASTNPDAIDRSLLAALTTDADFLLSPQSPNQGLRAMVTGLRPPLLRDFFDGTLFMRVNLKRKRFVLQVRAQIAPVDDI